MNHVLITAENIEDFKSVLPVEELPQRDRITLGAYNDDNEVTGAISFALIDYQYDIDWLYVVPSVRRQGIATGLLDEVFKFISKTGEIYPLSAEFEVTKGDRSLHEFFLSRDELDTSFSHDRYYVTPSELASSGGLKKTVELELTDAQFFSIPKEYQDKFFSAITADHGYIVPDKKLWKESCIEKLSRVICQENKLMAAIFIMGRSDGNLELSYLYSNNPMATKLLITRVAGDIIKYYPKAKLVFDVMGEKAEPMAKKLFPNSEVVPVYEAEW